VTVDTLGSDVAGTLHDGRDALAPLRVVDADHGRVRHGRVVPDDGNDFRRIDDFAAGDDSVVNPTMNPQAPIGILTRQVARPEATVVPERCRRPLVVEVARRHRRSLDHQFTPLAGPAGDPLLVENGHLRTEEWLADGALVGKRLRGPCSRDLRGGFGRSVGRTDGDVPLATVVDEVRGRGCTAEQHEPEVVGRPEAGIEQSREHRRDQRDAGHPLLVYHRGSPLGVERRLDDDRRSVQCRPEYGGESAHVRGGERA